MGPPRRRHFVHSAAHGHVCSLSANGYTPTSERIVEDISRYEYIQEKIIAAKGGLVQDFELQHKGCSKRKRKGGASRVYVAPPEVAAAAVVKRQKLREKARSLAEGV